jgi:hypothetical protein
MLNLKTICILLFAIQLLACDQAVQKPVLHITLIPPAFITDQIDLDIRAGIQNEQETLLKATVTFYLNEENEKGKLHSEEITLSGKTAKGLQFSMPAKGHVGKNKVLVIVAGKGFTTKVEKDIEIVSAATRSTKTIGGAWISFYHWSETEGKMWNPAIKNLTDSQWMEMVSGMHEVGMDIIVIQESFRNQAYVGGHDIDTNGYKGKAFYPSKLYPDRMPIAAKDPVEAVLTRADQLGMHVFMGVGMYAWFDYTKGSLNWHKKVAKELWDNYHQHPSFYGFYVSEEGMGSLDCFEKDSSKHDLRRNEVLNFFSEFTPFCKQLAPDKPVMFAPNGWGVGRSKGAYNQLMKNVDIICPFAFARMPEGDLTGKEAIARLQQYCDDNKAHLWLDLEAFLFNEKEGYLYPRPITEIATDLNQFDNFEKVICYQYPGVFNHPGASVRVGEASTVALYNDYQAYLQKILSLYSTPTTTK